MGWTFTPDWGSHAGAGAIAPDSDCPDCAHRAAQIASWDRMRKQWWGPLAGAALGAGIALVHVIVQGSPMWTVAVMAAAGPLVTLVGPPAEMRCEPCRSRCPSCGGEGERPGHRTQRAVIGTLGHVAGALLGLLVAGGLLVARGILTPWLFDEPSPLWYVFLVLLPVAGGILGGLKVKATIDAARRQSADLRCTTCDHRWHAGSLWARRPR